MSIGNGYQTYSDSTLKNLKKDTLIEYIRVLEENLRNAYERLDNQAKILHDREPVKHGKWNKRTTIAYCRNGIFIDYDEYLCSECQKVTEIKENYCSNCGAKMDLEGEQVETHQVGPCCVGGKKRE